MTALQPERLIGSVALDPSGNKIGKIGQVYFDSITDQPSWITVSTGLLGKQNFAPLAGARPSDEGLVLPVDKNTIKDAPDVEDDGQLQPQEEQALYDYYASYLGTRPPATSSDSATGTGSDEAMTRSEERLRVGTEQVSAGKARLRKYVVTEQVTQTVPVSHEELRVEREPITDQNREAATSGPDISEAEHEVTLHAERPVVAKETVPVERVRVGTDRVAEEETVSEQLRKEQIDVEDESDTTKRRR
ncbi:MAG: hypothetical protein QOE30_6181 [Mycobacterium sp.]|jgi:uncharacterized protein (TIGR02271 family)|uniref:YsnF/AvaK domain-containing protein n=1 Tax=Mycobacterium sp. TaxID=1785 RepID=UPI0028BA0FF6|nr:YsnF/AvaK domain-containing protein [Mycobacterium sp.]MDT5120442.1 hypothetical protein [Mycobacterium sp.]